MNLQGMELTVFARVRHVPVPALVFRVLVHVRVEELVKK